MGALPSEGVLGEGAIARARQMGQALFGQSRQAKEGECPTCWSEIWKFPQLGDAVCALCGQKASLVATEQAVRWVYEPLNFSDSMYDKEHMKNHFQVWLRGKVQEFISRRTELALVRNPYKGNDTWLVPQRD